MLNGKTKILTYVQKLFLSVQNAYLNPQKKFGSNTLIYKRDYFHTCMPGVF